MSYKCLIAIALSLLFSPLLCAQIKMSRAESFLTDHVAHNKRKITYDKQYENTEEKRVIADPEAKTAQASITPIPPKSQTPQSPPLVGKRFNRMKNN